MLWLFVILLFAVLIFGATPFAKHQLEQTLTNELGEEVRIEQLVLNPFQGRVDLVGMTLGGKSVLKRAQMEIALRRLVDNEVHIESLNLEGIMANVVVDDAGLRVLEIPMNQESEPAVSDDAAAGESSGWKVKLDELRLASSELALVHFGSRHILDVSSFSLENFSSYESLESDIQLNMTFDGTPIDISGKGVSPVANDDASFAGDINLTDLKLARYAHLFGDSVQGLNGSLDVKQQLTFSLQSGSVSLKTGGTLQARTLTEARGSVAAMRYTGGISIELDSELNPAFELDGDLQLDGVNVSDFADLTSIGWRGQVAGRSVDDFQLRGDLQLEGVSGSPLGTISSLKIDSIAFGSDIEFSAGELNIDTASLRIERSAEGNWIGLAAEEVEAEQPTQGDSSLVLLEQAEPIGTEIEVVNPASTGNALQIAIEQIQILNSRIEFIDRSQEPLVDLVLSDTRASVSGFTLTDKFEFEAAARHQADNEDATIGVKGQLNLATESGRIDVDLADFEIHELAPYLGNGVKSGRLQFQSNIEMSNGRVIVNNNIHIQRVKVDDSARGSSDQMSLATALFLLKDDKDVVQLEVPFETDFDNFEIGFADILQTAMLKAARTAAVTYAQYALQPYGGLLLAKNFLGAVTRPKFEPINFQQGQSELSDDDRAYVRKMADFLAKKQEITITICGFAQTAESAALQALVAEQRGQALAETTVVEPFNEVEQLKELAQARSLNVRELLVESGIPAKRLYACTASVESKSTKPRVELAL